MARLCNKKWRLKKDILSSVEEVIEEPSSSLAESVEHADLQAFRVRKVIVSIPRNPLIVSLPRTALLQAQVDSVNLLQHRIEKCKALGRQDGHQL